MSRMFTPKQVAEQLAVSPRTVYLWIEDGRLPAIRLSDRVTRIPAEELEAFVERAAGVRPGSGRRESPFRHAGGSLVAEGTARYGGAAVVTPVSGADDRDAVPTGPSRRLRDLLEAHRSEILAIAARRRAVRIRVIGSVARGDARLDSDIDLLVDLQPDASLLDLAGLAGEIEKVLGVDVDVVPARNLKPEARARVLGEAMPL